MSRIPVPVLFLLALSACQAESARQRTPVVVLAASSLTESFVDLEPQFEAAHPEVDLVVTFAGSQVLRLQLEQGVNADVFASANGAHMKSLLEEKLVLEPSTLAHNELVVIVPKENPAGLRSFDELTRARRVVVGSDSVPVGQYTQEMLDRAAIVLGQEFSRTVRNSVVSKENNVRLVRTKVELGEADAAIVYQTDAFATTRVSVIRIPRSINVQATYLIAATSHARAAFHARQFIDYAQSGEGQKVLLAHGFMPPLGKGAGVE